MPPVQKPDIALSRWAELEDGTPAANVDPPPDLVRDTGAVAGTSAKSRYMNELLRQQYRWAQYQNDVALLGAGGIDITSIYGMHPDGSDDDTERFLDAVAANPGRKMRLRKGRYVTSETIRIEDRNTRLVGEVSARAVDGGTEIAYSGTGACIEIGEDDGQPWDDALYDGPQDHWIENLHISHSARDTGLSLNPALVYKAGAVGIRDWRGGGIQLYNVGIEGFEYNFFGVNSDINYFNKIVSLYSKYGMYFGPRSDQCTVQNLYTFFCDNAIVLDGCSQFRLLDPQIVGCGDDTICPVEVRKGTSSTRLERVWFETIPGFGGYPGTDHAGLVSAGLVNGYDGDDGLNTNQAQSITLNGVHINTAAPGIAGHSRCLIQLGRARNVQIRDASAAVGSALHNLDALAIAPSGTNFSDASVFIHASTGTLGSLTTSTLFLNEGSGSPSVTSFVDGSNGMELANRLGVFPFIKPGAAAGADLLRLEMDGTVGRVRFRALNYPAAGQQDRLQLDKVVMHGAAAPIAGGWEVGDRVFNSSPAVGSPKSWVCTVSGTPGTWVSEGNL